MSEKPACDTYRTGDHIVVHAPVAIQCSLRKRLAYAWRYVTSGELPPATVKSITLACTASHTGGTP